MIESLWRCRRVSCGAQGSTTDALSIVDGTSNIPALSFVDYSFQNFNTILIFPRCTTIKAAFYKIHLARLNQLYPARLWSTSDGAIRQY
jgi:hypothetical protein